MGVASWGSVETTHIGLDPLLNAHSPYQMVSEHTEYAAIGLRMCWVRLGVGGGLAPGYRLLLCSWSGAVAALRFVPS